MRQRARVPWTHGCGAGGTTDRRSPDLRSDRQPRSRERHVTRVVVLGDSLLDRDWHGSATRLCPDSAGPVIDLAVMRSRAGGAALAATAVAKCGADVTFVTSLTIDACDR